MVKERILGRGEMRPWECKVDVMRKDALGGAIDADGTSTLEDGG